MRWPYEFTGSPVQRKVRGNGKTAVRISHHVVEINQRRWIAKIASSSQEELVRVTWIRAIGGFGLVVDEVPAGVINVKAMYRRSGRVLLELCGNPVPGVGRVVEKCSGVRRTIGIRSDFQIHVSRVDHKAREIASCRVADQQHCIIAGVSGRNRGFNPEADTGCIGGSTKNALKISTDSLLPR